MLRRRHSFWQASIAHRCLLIEAALHIMLARLALYGLPFRWLVWWFERPTCRPERQGEARRITCRKVRMAILYTNQRFGLHAVCFPLSVAAWAMLRRRGVSTTLYYGAATLPDQGKLMTHVWLQDGDEGIMAHEDITQFHVLACYSPYKQPKHTST